MKDKITNNINSEKLNKYRKKLLSIDSELIWLLGQRMKISGNIGKWKFINEIGIEQIDYWDESSLKRNKIAESLNLNSGFIEELFLIIQKESIKIQNNLVLELNNGKK